MNIKKKKNSFFKPALLNLEDRITPSAYVEPNVISANPSTHVLDITYEAHQSTQPLESLVAGVPTSFLTPGFLTYAWTINDGLNSVNGSPSAITTGDSYTGPTLKVNRGDTLRITLLNDLVDLGNLGITSLVDGSTITEMPLNNHVHGLHLSPNGSSDNVLLTMPAGQGFVYEYKISDNQPDGLYWVHPHNHQYSTEEVYRGLSSMLIIGTPDSSIAELASLPERTMSLQYQYLTNAGTSNQALAEFIGIGGAAAGQQLTINGKLNSTITVNPGQTEVWNIANMTPQANINFTLKNSSTNTNLPIVVVAQDGVPYSTPVTIPAGQALNLGTGGRYSILVTASTTATQNVQLNFNNSGKGGTYNVNMKSAGTPVASLPTPTTLTTTGYDPFVDLSTATVAENRTVTFSIDPSTNGQNAEYQINAAIFPNPEIFQPRLNTVEEWVLINNSSAAHPFHYHVNDIQIMSVFSPTNPLLNVGTPQQWYQDVINVPAALIVNGEVVTPGRVTLRTNSLDYTGAFVYHCHILPHEDRGMMGLNTIQPETPIYATSAGAGGGPQVNIFDGQTGNVLTQFFAYDESFRGGVTVAVGDIDGSGFNSVVTGAGSGGGSHVKSFRNSRFFAIDDTPILPGNQSISMNQTGEFMAYESAYTGGVQVAVGLNAGYSQGGFYRILTGTLTAGPEVTVWEAMETHDTTMDTPDLMFEKVADFFAFDSTQTTGVRVGSVAVSNGSDFLASTGSGISTVVRRYSLLPGASQPTLEEEFSPFTDGFDGGANLGGTY